LRYCFLVIAASLGMLALLTAVSPGYVGAKVCRSCHAEIHARWDASRHSKMVRPASPEGVRGDFSVKEVTLRGETYGLEAKDGKYFVTESKLRGKKTRHRILYTLGNRRIQHYLTKLEDGRIVVLPPSWDVLRKEWFHNMEIVGPEPANGVAVQVWNMNCFGCHVSQEERNFDLSTLTYDTDWVDFGTSCERCHGPGSDHVELYTSSETRAEDSAIVVQTRLDPARSTMVCGQCHSLRDAISLDFAAGADYYDYFLPQLEYGLPQDHDPAWYLDGSTRRFSNDTLGLWMSRCFLEGGVTCVDCHTDPHDTEIEKNAAIRPETSAICTRCHEALANDVEAHTRHPAASAGSSCVECHMPQNVVSIKARIRDHGIGLPAPENTERHGIPNACNSCHQDRTPAWAAATLDSWFPGSRARRQKLLDRADIFSQAKAGNPEVVGRLVDLAANDSEPPLIRANAVGYLGSFPSDPRVQPALLRAFGSKEPLIRAIAMPQIGKLRPSRLESVTPFLVRALDDEAATVRMGGAFALMSLGVKSLEGEAGLKFDAAKKIYVERAATSPDHAPTQLALGKFHVLNRDLASAASAFTSSLKLDPDQEDALYYRAIVSLGEGRKDEARDLLEQVGSDSSFYAAARALLQTLSER
jgi:predicted CXXCH cytochrome family protein